MSDERRKAAKSLQQRVLVFLLLTFAFSSVFYYAIISAGTLKARGGIYVLGVMWCPGIAALATQLLYQRNVRGLGWGWGPTRYQLLSYALPVLYALIAYPVVWGTGLGGFYNAEFVGDVSAKLLQPMGLDDPSPFARIAIYVLFAATVGMIPNVIFALGEEIGWRGFLVPVLAQVTTFTKTALVSGSIWAIWHYPGILFADYNAGTPVWYSLTCFTVSVLAISFPFTWLRLKSGSLWTGVFLHASHNLFIQEVFDPLTTDTGITEFVIGEFGAALAILLSIGAYVVWTKRSALQAALSNVWEITPRAVAGPIADRASPARGS